MFNDPTKDEETGEDFNFLIVDFNFFTTRLSFNLINSETNTTITKDAKIWFTGDNSNDIVNYSGEKNEEYTTSQGQLELTIDPNVTISESSLFNFAVNVEINGYEKLTQGIQISSEGIKTFDLLLTPESGEEETTPGEDDGDGIIFGQSSNLKSTKEDDSYQISYFISWANIVKCLDENNNTIFSSIDEAKTTYNNDPDNFVSITTSKTTDYLPVIDRLSSETGEEMVTLTKLEKGYITKMMLNNKKVGSLNGGSLKQIAKNLTTPSPDAFGFAEFSEASWTISDTVLNHKSFNSCYTLISASKGIATSGANIKFSSNSITSFSITGDIYNATTGEFIKTETFKGAFPETFVLENIPAVEAKIVFRDNNPSFKAINDLAISDLSTGNYEVDVDAQEGFDEYQIILKALCPSNSTVAIAPTYSGEYRIESSNDEWQAIEMNSGVVDILLKSENEYDIRLLWEDNWETASFSTKFDDSGNYINNTDEDIVVSTLSDNRTQFLITHEFEQDICESMGW